MASAQTDQLQGQLSTSTKIVFLYIYEWAKMHRQERMGKKKRRKHHRVREETAGGGRSRQQNRNSPVAHRETTLEQVLPCSP